MTAPLAAPARGAERNRGNRKVRAHPVRAYLNGVEWLDADMIYWLPDGRWLFVSEDGTEAYIYDSIRELLAEQRGVDFSESDAVIAGWDMAPYRFKRYAETEQYVAERFG
jgi:hypothetical protein